MKLLFTTLLFIVITISSHAQAVLVQDINAGTPESWPGLKYVFKNKMLFNAFTDTSGWQLFSYNDTTVSIVGGMTTGNSGGTQPTSMAIVNGVLYYQAYSSTTGCELYKWDGVNPPSLAKDVKTGTGNSTPIDLVALNNKIYFIGSTNSTYGELWVYDPATNIARNLNSLYASGTISGQIIHLAVFDNKIYFAATDNNLAGGGQLFLYDPVADTIGLAPYYNPSNGARVCNLSVCYNKLYYAAYTNTYGYELYVYDGKKAPIRLTDINPGNGNSLYSVFNWFYTPACIVGFNGYVYFTAGTITNGANWHGLQLYKVDPNKGDIGASVSFVYDIQGNVTEFIEFDHKLYFEGYDTKHGFELWMYDGIHDPSMIADINTHPHDSNTLNIGCSIPKHFGIYNNNLYFSATNVGTGYELYRLGTFPSAIENATCINTIRVYPMPVTNEIYFELNLKTDCNFTIKLYDITGREVYNSPTFSYQHGNATFRTDVSQLVSGNYLYRITTTSGVMLANGKVVKE
ncbi:MAG: T9SS type A sorting domain-containing protein [Bacteroidetes bacterium]|nr:T9SS type A sorting domain-containing protein [Bacteroidota bacterium]